MMELSHLYSTGPRALSTIVRLTMTLALACISQMAYGQSANTIERTHDRSKPITMLTFTIQYGAIWPREVSIPAGQYNLRLRNGMFVGDVTLQLSTDAGKKTTSLTIDKKNGKASGIVHLNNGTYELSVVNRPDLKATIQVDK